MDAFAVKFHVDPNVLNSYKDLENVNLIELEEVHKNTLLFTNSEGHGQVSVCFKTFDNINFVQIGDAEDIEENELAYEYHIKGMDTAIVNVELVVYKKVDGEYQQQYDYSTLYKIKKQLKFNLLEILF